MQRPSGHSSRALWLTAHCGRLGLLRALLSIVLILRLVVGFGLHDIPAAADDPGGERLQICTPLGMQWITLDAAGDPVPAKPSPAKAAASQCPLCLMHHAWGVLPAVPALESMPRQAIAQGIAVDQRAADVPGAALPRGPPAA